MTLLEYYEKRRPRDYETNWHHKWICRVLERAYTERRNAIIECPPRHSKSEIADVYGPAWRLDSHYDSTFGLVTNSDALAKKFSSACRNLCELPLEIDRDAQWKVKDLKSLNYTYLGAGIRGQLTGHGFDTVMFDDLLKSGQEAKSDTVREGVWENVVSAAINRLTPDGIVVALQARLHQHDTIGKLLSLDHLRFLHLHLPATNDSGTEAWFRDGYSGDETKFPPYAALWATRYSREKLDEIRATVTPYFWNAQYQAVPSLGDLAFFDTSRWPRYDHPTGVEFSVIGIDAGNTQTKSGSYSALVCLGCCGDHLKVLGARRGRWRQDVLIDELWEFYRAMARLTGKQPMKVIVERAAAGYGLIDHLSGKMPIEPLIPKGSKEERAESVCYLPNKGVVKLPTSGAWVRDFAEELDNFPLCADKDQVDAFVHCLSLFARPGEFDFKEEHEVFTHDEMGRGAQRLKEDLEFYREIGMDKEVAFEMVDGPEFF
jgi:phage terminase large subunit-like protein